MSSGRRAFNRRGEAYAAMAAIGYGSAYVAIAFALRSFEPIPATVDRAVLGSIALGLVVVARRGQAPSPITPVEAPPPLLARGIRLLVLGLVGGLVFLAGQVFAVLHIGAAIAAFVAGLYAVVAAVLAPFLLPEHVSRRSLAGFVVALAGTALLAELDRGIPDAVGLGWGLLGAVSFGSFLVLTRRWARPYRLDGMVIALATLVTTAFGFGLSVVLSGHGDLVPAGLGVEGIAAMAWLVITAAGGQALTAASVRLIPASRSAAFLLLTPISATVLAALLLGERPSPVQLAGGALVLAGIAAATLPPDLLRRRGET